MKNEVKWEQARKDWESGISSARAIASAHGISHTTVNKRAKLEDWKRCSDVTEKQSKEAEERQIDDSTGEIEMQRQSVEAAEKKLVQVRETIATFQSNKRKWEDRLRILESAAKGFGDDVIPKLLNIDNQTQEAHLDLDLLDELATETVLLQSKLKYIPGVEQHLRNLENDVHTELSRERITLEKLEGRAEYLRLRTELVETPRELTTQEVLILRGAAARGKCRDDHDQFVAAFNRHLYEIRKGINEKSFVWPPEN